MNHSEKKELTYQFKVAAFYSFTELAEDTILLLSSDLSLIGNKYNIMGTILVSYEGINGTICGVQEGVDYLIEVINNICTCEPLELKVSWTDQQAFRRFKVRHKAEIVTMGISEVDPRHQVGEYVEPLDWNEFLKDPETLVIDTRNHYEVGIGSFEGAINPKTNSFREFPSWVEAFLRPLVSKTKPRRIAMFCTGGIRCEKATSFLKNQGFEGVHHLHGGILRYLEEIPESQSLWNGECFVFDQRVALNHDLLPGEHLLCYACGMPLDLNDRLKSSYIRGVQCHYCEKLFSDSDRARFAERQKQYDQRLQKLLQNEAGA